MTTIEIEIPDDKRKDYEGMYEDCVALIGEEQVEGLIEQQLESTLADLLDRLYDQKEQLAQQTQ